MRRAIVMGSNGPAGPGQLKYAQLDAQRIAKSLADPRCGFTVDVVQPGTDPWNVRKQVSEIAEKCTYEDTLICYFSGHGIVERGALFLLWDETELERLLNTALPVEDIVRALKYCKANSKLLILDCCHAGAVVSMTGFKDGSGTAVRDLEITPDNHLILMASDRLEKARELEILGGSFLTANVCTALSTKLEEADKDGDSRLSVQELKLWLDECAKEHNKKYPALSVPYPYLFGQQKGGFFLTLGNSPWEPYEIPFPDGSTMVVLPSKDEYGRALLVSKYPVTNKQYRDFVNEARGKVSEPVGEHFIDGRWQGSFYPWRHPEFEDPEKPVVCVNAEEASWYCFWLDESNIDGCYVSLPHVYEWDFAAFGTFYPNSDPQTWLSTGQIIHHKAQYPAIIDKSGGRTNIRGISDLIGNVWEWCGGTNDSFYEPVIINRPRETRRTEVRGGSYLDDLERTRPFVEAHLLEKGTRTSHSDLGFRISARMAVSHLPSEVQKALIGRERVSLSRLINARLMRNSSMRKRATWSEGKEAGKDDKVSM